MCDGDVFGLYMSYATLAQGNGVVLQPERQRVAAGVKLSGEA